MKNTIKTIGLVLTVGFLCYCYKAGNTQMLVAGIQGAFMGLVGGAIHKAKKAKALKNTIYRKQA